MADDEFEFSEDEMSEFLSFGDSKEEKIDEEHIAYDPNVRLHLFRDGYYPTSSKSEMDKFEPVEVERSTLLHSLAYLDSAMVGTAALSDEEEAVVKRLVAKYKGNEKSEADAVRYAKKTGVMNPWYIEFLDDISVLEVHPGSVVVRDKFRSSIISGGAFWGSYICWLHCNGAELPFDESYDYSKIVEEGKAIYKDREGWGSIGHMYWSFKRLTVGISTVPSTWKDVYFGVKKLGEVISEPMTVIDDVAFNYERAEINACVVATASGMLKEYYTERLSTQLKIMECKGRVFTTPPDGSNFNVMGEYFYYGPFVEGLLGRVFPVAWSPPQWGLFLCTRRGTRITYDVFLESKKIFRHLMHQKALGYVTGCSCANCLIELRYGCATQFGLTMYKMMGSFPGHVRGTGSPFITNMLGALEIKVLNAMVPGQYVVFEHSSPNIKIEEIRNIVIRVLLGSRSPIDIYNAGRGIICRFRDNAEAKTVASVYKKKEFPEGVVTSRLATRGEVAMLISELEYVTGITRSFLLYMATCGAFVHEFNHERIGYRRPLLPVGGLDDIREVMLSGPSVGYTSYQLKFMIACEDNVKKVVKRLNALRNEGLVTCERSPSGELFWKAADVAKQPQIKHEMHYSIPQKRGRLNRVGNWSKLEAKTPKVFRRGKK